MSRERDEGNGPGDIGSFSPPVDGRPAVRFEIPKGTRFTACKGCTAQIAFVPMPSGRKMPVDASGFPHWNTCPGSADFRERKKLEMRLAELKAENAKR